MNKILIGLLSVILVTVVGMVMILRRASLPTTNSPSANVSMTNEMQTIQITAKGGYTPRVSIAKANAPTTLNIVTDSTYDCSSAITIPALGVRQSLPVSGVTPITIPPQPAGTSIKGLCAMGMYSFTVNFSS